MTNNKKAPRTYQFLWERLKRDHFLCVECFLFNAKTVRRMIIKEKDQDTAFKLEDSLNGNNLRLKIKEIVKDDESGKVKLTFALTSSKEREELAQKKKQKRQQAKRELGLQVEDYL